MAISTVRACLLQAGSIPAPGTKASIQSLWNRGFFVLILLCHIWKFRRTKGNSAEYFKVPTDLTAVRRIFHRCNAQRPDKYVGKGWFLDFTRVLFFSRPLVHLTSARGHPKWNHACFSQNNMSKQMGIQTPLGVELFNNHGLLGELANPNPW